MAGATDLYDICYLLLEACYNALERTPTGSPSRVYVSPGVPPWDCEQLTVHAGGPAEGDTAPLQPPLQPGHRVPDGREVRLVSVTATILRCAPTTQTNGQVPVFPKATALDACAQIILSDCWAIWNHLATLKRDDALFGPKTREFYFDPAIALSAAGGFVGWELPFRVQLGGYRTGS